MKVCLMCDLHLSFEKGALQYNVLDWAIEDIRKKQPGCIIYAGDVTGDGNLAVYEFFLETMNSLNIPFIYIPGNSDLRCNETKGVIAKKASPCRNLVEGVEIIALNDCECTINEQQYAVLSEATKDSIVFLHHPMDALKGAYGQKLSEWREKNQDTMVFYGHLHKSEVEHSNVSLQAMDPDKAIGECPCITYYDTDTRQLYKEYYNCPVPKDIYGHFGVSCIRVDSDIEFAIANGLKNLELRPNILACDYGDLKKLIDRWRAAGGENLSVHLPDIRYVDGAVCPDDKWEEVLELADNLKADRFTQHVPIVSVQVTKDDSECLPKIARFLAEKFNGLKRSIIVGVENMHMTAKDEANDTRRFGYLPEECLAFMNILKKYCRNEVGINFDIGHARNNMPYSQKYQISTWLTMVGRYIVGYHMHQVTLEDGEFHNHMPITDIYGRLISYASFFKYWEDAKIQKVPIIFEMRPDDAYAITLNTFQN